jgi:hypothetical protein
VGATIEFDWDDENTLHVADHGVSTLEFEEVLNNGALDLSYDAATAPKPASGN